ncbi:MAG: Hemagglutinin family protein [Parcubacteria group bacterium GW2011_GWA2_47_7]|nr:MAG: Hemagglutinin family protein [Parcubacteria group bacterium GW2011_GWA2_47_7]
MAGGNMLIIGAHNSFAGVNTFSAGDNNSSSGGGGICGNGNTSSALDTMIGNSNTGSGNGSIVIGNSNTGSGSNVIVIGNNNTNSGDNRIIIGDAVDYDCTADLTPGHICVLSRAVTVGRGPCVASPAGAGISCGERNIVSGGSIAVGSGNTVSGGSIAIGDNLTCTAGSPLSVAPDSICVPNANVPASVKTLGSNQYCGSNVIPTPVTTITSGGGAVTSGQTGTITWTATNAPTSCTVYNADTDTAVSGAIVTGTWTTPSLVAPTRYYVVCENAGGLGPKSASVGYTILVAPSCSGATPCGTPGSCFAKSGCDNACGSTAINDCAGTCGGSATDYNGAVEGCGGPLNVTANPVAPITLPTTAFTSTYTLTNGTAANTNCQLLDNASNPLTGYAPCLGVINYNTPASAGVYGYFVQASKSLTSEVKTSAFSVTVAAANVPPSASAGSNKAITLPTNSVTISGASASDPDGSVVSTIWSKVSGPNVPTITGGTTLTPTFSGLIVGTYKFNLAVTDNSGQVTNSTMTITVSNPPAPTMTATVNGVDTNAPNPILVLSSVTPFTLSMSAPGATSVTWSRVAVPAHPGDFGTSAAPSNPWSLGPTTWAGEAFDRTYDWTFTAYNAVGASVTKHIRLKILAAVPKLTVFPSSALFTSAPVGNTTLYKFTVKNDFGESGSVLTGTASSDVPTHFYCVSCTYTVPKGSSVDIWFTFKATAPLGTYNGVLTFTNNQDDSDYKTAVNFGSVALTGLPAGFTCTSGCTLNLANNIVNTVTIRFAPTVVGSYGLAADPSSKVYPGALSDYYFTVKGEGVTAIFNIVEQ